MSRRIIGSFTDRSGTVTSGGASQQIMAENDRRIYLFVQNVSTASLWVNIGTAAVETQPSIKLPPDASLEYSLENTGFIPTDAVNLRGPATGLPFTAKEV